MPKQSDSTSFDLAEYKEYKQYRAMKAKAEAEANKAEAKAEAPKKRGRPAKGSTTAKQVVTKAVFTMFKNGKWVPTGGKGSAHFTKLKEAGIVLRCDSPKGYTTIWNVETGVKL